VLLTFSREAELLLGSSSTAGSKLSAANWVSCKLVKRGCRLTVETEFLFTISNTEHINYVKPKSEELVPGGQGHSPT